MKKSALEQAITPKAAQGIYNRLGKRYDWFEFYDARAKERSMEYLDLAPGQQVLHIGVGTGNQHTHFQASVSPGGGFAFGLDISPVMAALARERSGAPICQADVHDLPFVPGRFDRLYAAYVLDLLPTADLPGILAGFYRVLKSGGRMVLVSLTEGNSTPSRALVAAWKTVYALSPTLCAGCRPLQLGRLVEAAGFQLYEREVIVQLSVPSEILTASKPC